MSLPRELVFFGGGGFGFYWRCQYPVDDELNYFIITDLMDKLGVH